MQMQLSKDQKFIGGIVAMFIVAAFVMRIVLRYYDAAQNHTNASNSTGGQVVEASASGQVG
jgi:dolichol kinase